MGVTVLSEEEERPRLKLVAATPEEATPKVAPRAEPRIWNFPTKEVIAALAAISAIVAVRAILLIAVLIGGVLGFMAVQASTIPAIVAATVYYLGVVGPMAFLAWKKG